MGNTPGNLRSAFAAWSALRLAQVVEMSAAVRCGESDNGAELRYRVTR